MGIIEYVSCYAIYLKFEHDILSLRQNSFKISQIRFVLSTILTKNVILTIRNRDRSIDTRTCALPSCWQ